MYCFFFSLSYQFQTRDNANVIGGRMSPGFLFRQQYLPLIEPNLEDQRTANMNSETQSTPVCCTLSFFGKERVAAL